MDGSDLLFPLFVPATRPERLAKARGLGADWVILDLEDAVAPADKPRARAGLAKMALAAPGAPVAVRINGAETPWHAEDIEAVSLLPVAGVVLPKAEDPDLVRGLRDVLPKGMALWGLIETARGVANVRALAPLFDRLLFGALDLAADLGIAVSDMALAPARAEVVLAARIAGRPGAIDAVTPDVRDMERVASEAGHGAAMGFRGKMLIHPAQIAPALDAWRPGAELCDWATRVLAAPEGVGVVDGQMVDAPVIARARRILADATATEVRGKVI